MNWKIVSKKVLKWSAAVVGGLVLCIALLLGLLQTDTGRKALAEQASAVLSGGDRKVEIGTLQGVVPFRFTIGSLSVADEHGLLLKAANLEIDWSPLSTLRGEFHVRSLKCGSFHLDRLPQGKAGEDDSFQLPRRLALLERIRVDHISVAEIVTGESLLGESAAFTLKADLKAALPGGEWVTRLVLDRTDGPEARLLLHGTVRENGRYLGLNVEAREAQQGLLSRRAGIEGPIAFTIQGEGPRSEWAGRMEVKAGGAGSLSGRIQASYGVGLHLGVEGFAEPEPEILAGFLEAGPAGRIRFSFKGGFDRDRQLQVEHLSLESGEAGLDLSGSSNLRDGGLKIHFRARHNEISALEKGFHLPLAGRVVLEGDISGTFFSPSAVLRVDSAEVLAAGVRFSGLRSEIHVDTVDTADGGKGGGPGLRLKGQGRVTGLSIPGMAPLPERDLDWSFSGERCPSGGLVVQGLNLKGAGNSLQLSGEIDPSTWEGSIEAEAETGELGPLSKRLGMDLPGSGRLKTALRGNFRDLSLSGVLQGSVKPEVGGQRSEVGDRRSEVRGQRSEVGDQRSAVWLRPILREGFDLKAEISVDRGRRLAVSDLRISNPLIILSASGKVDLERHHGKTTAHVRVLDLAPWASPAGIPLLGSLEADGTLEGSPGKITIRTELRGKEVHAGKVQLGRLRAELNGSGDVRANGGSFRFEAGGETVGVSGEGHFSKKGERLSLTKVLLSGPGNSRAAGGLEFDLGTRLAEGRLSGECPDLAPFSEFVNQPLRGKLLFNARMDKGRGAQQLELSFSGADLKADPFEAGEMRLQATLTELSPSPRGDANVSCRDVRLPGAGLSSLSMRLTGDGSQASFEAAAKGTLDRTFRLETRGVYRHLQGGSHLTIARLQGKYGELPFRIAEPVALERSAAEISAASFRVVLGGGSLSGRGKLSPGEVDVHVSFEKLPINLIRHPALPLEGSGSGELALRGKLGQPDAMTRVRITGLRGQGAELKGVPPAVLEARADLRGQRVKGELTLQGVTSKPFTARLDVPLRLSLQPFGVSFPEGVGMKGDLDGRADLARLGGFLGLYDQAMSGIAEVSLQLEGTPHHPLITGTIGVEDGGYESARVGTLLKQVNVRLAAGTKRVVIEHASASDGEEGVVLARGWLDVEPEMGFPFQVDLSFEKMQIARHDWVTAKGNGEVRLEGSFSHAVLTGEVRVEKGELRIPERLPPEMPELEVVEINSPDATTETRTKRGRETPFLDLDLRLRTGHFLVRGRGLESEWAGELRLAGPAVHPALTGELAVERGRFTFLDRRFTLNEGKITFDGLAHPSPFLDVLAESSAKDITVQLRLVGPVRTPEIKLSSEPPFPPDEVLSRLLFGQGMNRISPLQAIQLAQTLNMMGGKQSLDLLGATRKLLRIDQLEFKQSGENGNETSVAAGKYLRDNVYIEVERSLGPGGTKATVEWEFSPHISVETQLGADAESGVGINWKWDY